ncbi:DUF4956 domain-containing protein [Ureibacillus suwonensis]|uniref:DUF4956 domain-containing protein n=1 Tax=Ureibacillus suwonensis TaxID=313007 RepID=A0ABW0RDC4_9BACL
METLNFSDIFKSSFLEKTTTISVTDAVICIISSLILGLFIYFVYKKTFKGVIYSHSFNISLIIMTMATALVIMGISQNILLSLGMVGALSIVRFRTPIKDPMDLIYLFWSVIVGILCGAELIVLAVVGSIIIGLVIILFANKIKVENPYLLVIKYSNDITNEEIEQLLAKSVKKFALKSNSIIQGYETEITYEIRVKENHSKIVTDLSNLKGIQSAVMLSYDGNFTA